jgi:hypothetical protein
MLGHSGNCSGNGYMTAIFYNNYSKKNLILIIRVIKSKFKKYE